MKHEKKCENCIHFLVCHDGTPCENYTEPPVRCEDCVHRSRYADSVGNYMCCHPNVPSNFFVTGDHFCACGTKDKDIALTVDEVVVVRCEKCRFFFDGACMNIKNRIVTRVPDFGERYSYADDLKVPKDHFCGHGERRADHENL